MMRIKCRFTGMDAETGERFTSYIEIGEKEIVDAVERILSERGVVAFSVEIVETRDFVEEVKTQ